ncbi:FecR domain-containing protein [Paraburkholderia sp.]|uniref:FecR domain-containing protein n=1 Tax=Paraburkholderia sp. TaxID=1926495 RepID=UPI0023928D3E|nr:FecR domain-containing protein [Paraburkholderia sp.]MDE1182174.1 FecR domain-containing protein [Paraburkholderia sp.]
MHPADDVSATHPADDGRPLDRAIVRAAAAWLVRLQEDATPDDIAACERWRAADPEHERTWQRACRLNEKFSMLPRGVGMPALGRESRIDRRAAIKTLTVMLVAAPGAYLAYKDMPWREWTSDERTAVGEHRSVVLADGTQVDLNTATAFDIAFNATERRVILNSGEILVETGPDTNNPSGVYRPFIVQTRDGQIRALGTRFVIRDDTPSGRDTLVAVLHGAVEITPRDAPHLKRIVDAGQQTQFTSVSVDPLRPADRHIADWSRGVLFADRMRLDDFLAAIARYRRGLLRCDPAAATLRITGAFQLDNTDNILAALPATLPVRVLYRTRYWVSVGPASDTHDAT